MDVVVPYIFALYPLLLAAAAIFCMYKANSHYWENWISFLLATSSVILFVYLTSPWVFISYYLRYLILVAFAVVVVYSYFKMILGISKVEEDDRTTKAVSVVSVVVFLVFIALNTFAIMSRYPSDNSVNVAFPFKSGSYYVLQSGNNFVTNPFHAMEDSNQATDIVKLNAFGNRALGISPSQLDSYAIFGDVIYSPCDGEVLLTRDDLPDNLPGDTDTVQPKGNYVLMKCNNTELLLVHLKQDSVKVNIGEMVDTGQALAEVGNSGNTIEPHLHISAMQDNKPVELVFDAQAVSINTIIKVSDK
ncbi:M23 family metallopeptidase [Hydrogenovibrio kuenenii]|uniref:M23 family metallopeptidase n=1 Tax=Hydrogenovibrio kuenenii TaxID=63658 RepID=UPI0004662052|nr:M23 family metallopeptidase [Hydrogenovibrio kuenenii]